MEPRTPWLLLAGACAGLILATWGLLEDRSQEGALPQEAAAVVGERMIRRVDYQRVLAGVEGDLRNAPDEALRRRVLDRMIDEELLVQRALELGLAVVDRRVRGELTSGLIDSIVSGLENDEPSPGEIARHYDENLDFFTRPGRLRARTIFFSKRRNDSDPRGTAAERAQQAYARIGDGESMDAVERDLGDAQVSPVPDGLLPPSKVRDYVGPTLLEALMKIEKGSVSAPIENAAGLHLAHVVDREPPIVPELAQIEDLVRQDLERRRGDQALRDYLDDLRVATPVQIDERIFSDRAVNDNLDSTDNTDSPEKTQNGGTEGA